LSSALKLSVTVEQQEVVSSVQMADSVLSTLTRSSHAEEIRIKSIHGFRTRVPMGWSSPVRRMVLVFRGSHICGFWGQPVRGSVRHREPKRRILFPAIFFGVWFPVIANLTRHFMRYFTSPLGARHRDNGSGERMQIASTLEAN